MVLNISGKICQKELNLIVLDHLVIYEEIKQNQETKQ